MKRDLLYPFGGLCGGRAEAWDDLAGGRRDTGCGGADAEATL